MFLLRKKVMQERKELELMPASAGEEEQDSQVNQEVIVGMWRRWESVRGLKVKGSKPCTDLLSGRSFVEDIVEVGGIWRRWGSVSASLIIDKELQLEEESSEEEECGQREEVGQILEKEAQDQEERVSALWGLVRSVVRAGNSFADLGNKEAKEAKKEMAVRRKQEMEEDAAEQEKWMEEGLMEEETRGEWDFVGVKLRLHSIQEEKKDED